MKIYGDGHYCQHHPDDPTHGEHCYDINNFKKPTLNRVHKQFGKKDIERIKKNNEKLT